MTRLATPLFLVALLAMRSNQSPPVPVEKAATAPTQAVEGTIPSKRSPGSTASTGAMRLTEPAPLDFNDHEDYVSLFDGLSLKNWDGHPKFWRVEDGAIIGESTAKNPSGKPVSRLPGIRGEGLHAEIRDESRRERRDWFSIPEQDGDSVALANFADGHRQHRPG